jgi:formylglycine-generating enzyme required for sulfatase activity
MKRTIWSSLLLALLFMSMAITMGCSDDTIVNGLSGNGRIGVYPSPETAKFHWTLTGPGSYAHADSGDVVIDDLEPGEYTLTWQDLNGWVTPEPSEQTKTLGSGKFMQFNATYRATGGVALPGQVQLNPNPDSIVAPWTLQGPDGFEQTGTGDNTLVDMPSGDYTVIWGDVLGWETPPPATGNLVEGEGLTFTAEYLSLSASAFIFTTIPAGTFDMGSPRSEIGALPHEWPQHSVTLTKDFDMSVTEVSWAQYNRVMGEEPGYMNPSYFYALYFEAFPDFNWPTHPMDSLTWMDAIRFCNALSTLEGFTPVYTIVGETVNWDQSADGYRLPTEAEWEYAARGGTVTPLYNGSFEMQASSCYFEPNLEQIAWYCENSPGSGVTLEPSPVASLDANDFGLYDMSGNLWEWVWDVNDTYDGVPMFLGPFDNGSEIINVGSATIVAELSGLGTQHVMRTQSTNCTFGLSSLGLTTSQVSVSYLDFGTIANLKINGGDLYVGELALAPAVPAPGVTMAITTEPTTHETFGAGVVGTIVLTGNITTLEIGGELLWIDDLAITDSASGTYALDGVVDFDLIKLNSAFFPDDDPFSVELLLGTTVTDPLGPQPVMGDARMLRGGSYANEPRRCRSASRSLISDDSTAEVFFPRYAGFRFVRTINP